MVLMVVDGGQIQNPRGLQIDSCQFKYIVEWYRSTHNGYSTTKKITIVRRQ